MSALSECILLINSLHSRGTGIRCGWSALHGQSNNPYIEGGQNMADGLAGHSVSLFSSSDPLEPQPESSSANRLLGTEQSPGGSSSGSGIAVAAGLAPIAIGTETEGSLISPSTRNSLYTIKPTLGALPNEGIIPVSIHLDTAGPMCTTVKDIADLLTVLVQDGRPDAPTGGYSAAMKGKEGWKELSVGCVDPDKFCYDDESLQTSVPEAIDEIVSLSVCVRLQLQQGHSY